jgi:GTP-binding protein
MDSRHPLTELDLQMLGWFAPTGKPIHVLLSKADKLTRQEQVLSLRQVQAVLKDVGGNCTCQLFSSLKKSGVGEAEAVLSRWLGLEIRDEAPPIAQSSERTARPKKRSAVGWSARHGGNIDKR